MIYIQSYHSRVVGSVQVRKKIPARESLERPLVCMPRPCWLSASMVTTALSLTVLLVCFSLDLDMTSVRVDRYACMGCQSGQSGHGATYFPTYKAAACHFARGRAYKSNRCIRLVTIQCRPCDRDAGGAGASGPWPPSHPNPPGSGVGYIPIGLYTSFATYHLLSEIYHLFCYGCFRLYSMLYSKKCFTPWYIAVCMLYSRI